MVVPLSPLSNFQCFCDFGNKPQVECHEYTPLRAPELLGMFDSSTIQPALIDTDTDSTPRWGGGGGKCLLHPKLLSSDLSLDESG